MHSERSSGAVSFTEIPLSKMSRSRGSWLIGRLKRSVKSESSDTDHKDGNALPPDCEALAERKQHIAELEVEDGFCQYDLARIIHQAAIGRREAGGRGASFRGVEDAGIGV